MIDEHPRRAVISIWKNPVTRALREGKVCVGAVGIAFPSPAIAQIVGQAAYTGHLVLTSMHTADTATAITRLRVQEAPQPVRERPQWRAPRKVVLLAFANSRGWAGREAAFGGRPGCRPGL